MKILVIEDNVELLQDIKNFLEREGNVCEIAPDYKTAYMKVGIFPYDILVVDITLPDGNGLDIIKEKPVNCCVHHKKCSNLELCFIAKCY